jgi:hypothetical protein
MALLLLCTLCAQGLFAQGNDSRDGEAREGYSRGLGFSVGSILGTGLSWQQWAGKLGWQVIGGAYFVPPGSSLGYPNLDYWVGLEGFYELYGGEFARWLSSRLYLCAGLGHHGLMRGLDESTLGPYEAEFALAAGFGIDAALFRHLALNVEVGYAARWPLQVDLVSQFSVHYRF